MMVTILAAIGFVCALLPAYVFYHNQFCFQRLPEPASELPSVSVLIPARNEETSIRPCVESILASQNLSSLEVIVLDDQSEDSTAEVVRELARSDQRVRLESSNKLPSGWCGKQHACAQLAKLASHSVLVFIDADVRLSPDALARMDAYRNEHRVDLLSGFPRQITHTWGEKMLIPLMHFVLLGFLSLKRMRQSRNPAFGAGCGQLFMTERRTYEQSGGHTAIRESLHDGLKLPRAYRRNGMTTDVFDASDVATCRMYRNAMEVWHGLKKNATEGIASAGLIVPVTIVLLCGQVLPFGLAAFGLISQSFSALAWSLVLASWLLAWVPRFWSAMSYNQSWSGALLHPISIVVFLAIQWTAFIGSFSRRTVAWKGRPYPA